MNRTLTPAEMEIVDHLKKKLDTTSCFGEMMRIAIDSNKPEAVRQLLADIRAQSLYAPDAIVKVIGLSILAKIFKLYTSPNATANECSLKSTLL